jgi:hypothetical protein
VKVPDEQRYIRSGPLLNRLVATHVCYQTGGLPDETYPAYSSEIGLAFEALDTFIKVSSDVKLTIEYPFPEVWLKRSLDGGSEGWFPVAYIVGDSLPHAICLAILKATGHENLILAADAEEVRESAS